MKLSTHFELVEFVPKEIYDEFGENSIWFIDHRIIDIAEVIRSRFASAVTINNWAIGGSFNNRGFRMPDSKSGRFLSQHKFGRAIDMNVADKTAQEVYEDIVKNFDIYSKVGLTTMEDIATTPGHCHLDCRKTNQSEIFIVS